MKKALQILKIILGWPISAVAIFFIFKTIFEKTGDIAPYISSINYFLVFLSLVSYVTFYFIRAYVYKKVLAQKGYNLPLKKVSFLWGTSELKRYTPGNIWSFLGRTFLFSKEGIPKKDIGLSILYEIEIFLIGCILVSILSVSFILNNFLSDFSNLLFVPSIVLVFFIAILFIFEEKLPFLNKIRFINKITPHFSPDQNLNLIISSSLYMFFYGLGTFFAVSSIIYLPLNHFSTFIGFFVFTLLVGYLTIITPMGLGVREGLMTFGLSKFISLGLAGASSIYSRLLLILSELIFLGLSFLWFKSKSKILNSAVTFIDSHKKEMVLAVFILSYILYFTAASFARYHNFYTGRFDLGNMDQTVWNSANGRIFQMTDPDGTEPISRLAFHADFILVLLAPFYFIFPDPRTLLFIQTAVLAIGAWFVFLIGKEVLKNSKLSLVFSFVYLLNPALNYVNLYDFHAVSLATTFLLACFYFLIKKKYLFFLVFAISAAVTKEQVWLTVSLIGAYIFLKNVVGKRFDRKELAIGSMVFLSSFFIFYYLISFAIPSVRGGEHFALPYYSQFGNTPYSVVKGLIFSPEKTFGLLFEQNRISYIKQLLIPLGFLSVLSPLYIVFAIPDFMINLLSNNPQLHQIYYQYSSVITPFIFISAIYGIKRAKDLFPKIPVSLFAIYLVTATLYSAYSFGPLPGAKKPNLDMFTKPLKDRIVIEDALKKIPESSTVAATNNLGSHLSQRERIFTIPIGMDGAEYIVFLLNDPFAQPSLNIQKNDGQKFKRRH